MPAGSVLGALDAVVNEEPPDDDPSVFARSGAEWEEDLARLRDHNDSTVRLAAELAGAVLGMRAGAQPAWGTVPRLLASVDTFERTSREARTSWADWAAPPGLVDRTHAVVLLMRSSALTSSDPPDLTGGWVDGVLARVEDIDAERHAATALRLALEHRVVPREILSRFDQHVTYMPGRVPTAWSHRQTRSLAAEVADAWALLDEPHRAAFILTVYREDARATGADPGAVEECDLALLDLCRRYRTTEFCPSIRQLAREGPPRVRAEAWLVLTLVEGSRPETPTEAGSWHGWWRCQDYYSLTQGDAARWMEPQLTSPDARWPARTADVDNAEWARLRGLPASSDDHAMPGGNPWDPHLWLRWAALRATEPDSWPDEVQDLLDGLPPLAGTRAAVRVAEELNQRLPREALALIDSPGRWSRRSSEALRSAGDVFGAAAATILRARIRQRAGLPVDDRAEVGRAATALAGWPAWAQRARLAVLADGAQVQLTTTEASVEMSGEVVPPPSMDLDGWGAQPGVRRQPGERSTVGEAGGLAPARRAEPADVMSAIPVLRHNPPGSVKSSPDRRTAVRRGGPVTGSGLLARRVLGGAWLLMSVPLIIVATSIDLPRAVQVALLVLAAVPIVGSAGLMAIFTWDWAEQRHRGRLPAQLLNPLPPRRFGPYRVRRGGWFSVGVDGRVRPAEPRRPARDRLIHPSLTLPAIAVDWLAKLVRSLGPRLLSGRSLWDLRDGRIRGSGRARAGRAPRSQPELRLVVLEVDRLEDGGDWERRLAEVVSPEASQCVVFARLRPGTLRGYLRFGRRPSGAADFHGPPHLRPTDAAGAPITVPGLTHVIGTPVRTSSGIRLRVADGDAEPEGPRGGMLLGIEDLDVHGSGLTVLQADPVDGGAAPLDEDRRGFVDLAIAALDAGSLAVIVLPPLPDALAAAAAEAIWVAARAVRPGADRGARSGDVLPVIAVREAKAAIYAGLRAASGEPATDLRAGDDVLLFLG
ncbi:hypothetical protein [Frankia sp. AgB32]|uniref:hypothetical protein n=1 Tax=Frankia sp. AgB32 TaxID=631119 RepID=UPI00200DBBD7|nr:hypothetical protein [Frankia sp. AgB32]MCK9896621.1 hypothetical protein [Frankia sp. AgB32]